MGREGPPACQETGSQSHPSKERGEKASLQKAGPIPAEPCLPSQSGSGGQTEGHLPAGAWESTGGALGGYSVSAVTGPGGCLFKIQNTGLWPALQYTLREAVDVT